MDVIDGQPLGCCCTTVGELLEFATTCKHYQAEDANNNQSNHHHDHGEPAAKRADHLRPKSKRSSSGQVSGRATGSKPLLSANYNNSRAANSTKDSLRRRPTDSNNSSDFLHGGDREHQEDDQHQAISDRSECSYSKRWPFFPGFQYLSGAKRATQLSEKSPSNKWSSRKQLLPAHIRATSGCPREQGASCWDNSSKEQAAKRTGEQEEPNAWKQGDQLQEAKLVAKQATKRKGFLYLKKQRSGLEQVAYLELAGGWRSWTKLSLCRHELGREPSLLGDYDQQQLSESNKSGAAQESSMEKEQPKREERRGLGRLLASLGAFVLLLAACWSVVTPVRALQAAQPPPPFRSQPVGPNRAGQTQVATSPGLQPASLPQPAGGSLVAQVNCNKIRGHVTLTPNLQGGSTVSTQISAGPPGEVYQWSVHQFPVKPGSAMCSCSALILGAKLLDLSEMHGNLPSDQEFSVQSSLNLFGPDSPVGHSLLLRGMKTGMVACATFLPTSRKSNYRAKFHTPLSGSVTIFQTAFGTSFISHLMYSNGTRRHSSHRFDLVRSADDDIMAAALPLSGAQAASASAAAASTRSPAGDLLEVREYENELAGCRRLALAGSTPSLVGGAGWEPLLRNMSYQLLVSTENFGMRGRSAHVLPQIPFETFSSVYLVVYSEFDPSEPIACAPLRFVKPKTAAAKFQSVSVQGNVIFSQDSPYDPTIARVNLQLPNSDGHSYGIDELPMIIRRKSDTRVCPNIREIIYNPHHVEPSSVPAEGEATSDQYAVGDLSGKYGSLTGKATEKIQVTDYNLPLFGPVSIVGRAMTVYSAEGVAIACSNVELTAPMTTAFATFDFGIQGQFIFRQPFNDCHGDTYIYIEVSKPVAPVASSSSTVQVDHNSQRTQDHNWHIHVNPVDSGLEHLSTSECSPAGPHFNPYNTSTSSIYSRDCTPFNVLRCELGDLSSKMFTIDIPPYRVKGAQEPDIGKFFGTDIDLPLCGPTSIVNRSVVVHQADFSHHRLACSTVIEFKPRSSSA